MNTPLSNTAYFPLIYSVMLALVFSSCVQHRQLINFNEADLPEDTPEQIVNAMNLTIQPEDLLRIDVHSIDPLAAAPFNPGTGPDGQRPQNMQMMQGNQGQGGNYMLELFQGYLVDQNGYIDFPVLGQLKVQGLTIEEAKGQIYGLLQEYLKDPVVEMRFLNLKITILGEVNVPGVQRLSNKRVTLLEAIGMAGDLSDYANRNNVLVIREEEGRRTYTRLDLQSAEIFTSPYFYMQQNDVIYVEPIQARIATVADPAQRIISYTTAGLSLISLIIALSR
ncbi:polysaccharide biosynthesis/export family protein [Phaeodactylibacter xiamenensis]|uniref:polysaccharide biosynthesis/export family protein n=1 Tax=Phaeodactylibacter xiamenensis TaxID=1524460 RepID=UPI0024A84D20|nr:polysaccharide biosynthesis/export family protein [Phaeodactylibacter xiamenensis]